MEQTTGLNDIPPNMENLKAEALWSIRQTGNFRTKHGRKAERIDRELPQRGYDDPTAHCFVAGVPRSIYAPSPHQILQPPGYVVMLFERMSWRVIPVDGRPHIPDNIRLWQGDSVGHWEGDTLVVETRNLNGKTWLNEVGDVVSHAETVIERFTPTDADTIIYTATVTDPARLYPSVDDPDASETQGGRITRSRLPRGQSGFAALKRRARCIPCGTEEEAMI